MAAKKGAHQASGGNPLADAIDRLYAAPLDEFVVVRRELQASLRAAGELPASRIVAGATKPSRTAWALNQVARHQPERLQALFDAREAAAKAQTRSDAEHVRSGVRDYRERLADVVRAARETLDGVGVKLDATGARRIGESLQAASTDDEMHAKLMAGLLVRDLEDENPFAGLGAGSPRPPGRAHVRLVPPYDDGEARKRHAAEAAAREREVQRERAERERAIDKGRELVVQAENNAREARADARKAEVAAMRAQSAADRARRAVVDAEKALEQARSELKRLMK